MSGQGWEYSYDREKEPSSDMVSECGIGKEFDYVVQK